MLRYDTKDMRNNGKNNYYIYKSLDCKILMKNNYQVTLFTLIALDWFQRIKAIISIFNHIAIF